MGKSDFYSIDYSVGKPVRTKWDDLILSMNGPPTTRVEKEGRFNSATGFGFVNKVPLVK